jgi:DNA modification methylase
MVDRAEAAGMAVIGANLNTVMHGNCVDVMSRMPSGSVDFVITDPPYIPPPASLLRT